MLDSLQPYGPKPTRLLYLWDSPDKITGMVCHALLQGIFLTRVSYVYMQRQAGSLPLVLPGKPLTCVGDVKCLLRILKDFEKS